MTCYQNVPKYLKASSSLNAKLLAHQIYNSVKGSFLYHACDMLENRHILRSNYENNAKCTRTHVNKNKDKLENSSKYLQSSASKNQYSSIAALSLCTSKKLWSARLFHTSCINNDIYMIANEEEFEDKVMRSSLPVVINFHADWCEPCHALKPLLENLAEKFQGRMHLAEVSCLLLEGIKLFFIDPILSLSICI